MKVNFKQLQIIFPNIIIIEPNFLLDLTGVSIFLLYYSQIYDKETTYDYAFSLLEQTLIS